MTIGSIHSFYLELSIKFINLNNNSLPVSKQPHQPPELCVLLCCRAGRSVSINPDGPGLRPTWMGRLDLVTFWLVGILALHLKMLCRMEEVGLVFCDTGQTARGGIQRSCCEMCVRISRDLYGICTERAIVWNHNYLPLFGCVGGSAASQLWRS